MGSLFANGVEKLSKACNLNDSNSCVGLGLLYYKEQDYFKAKELFGKACILNNGGGCFGLGRLYYDGLGVKQDFTKAKELFGKACDLGNQDGCELYRMLNEKNY